jgi:biotin carboxyl carrier protein
MKLQATLAGRDHEVELHVEGTRVIAKIDDRHYELSLSSRGAGRYVLIHENRVFDCEVVRNNARVGLSEVRVGKSLREVVISDPKRLRATHGGGAHDDGSAQITAPMPGKVVRILVEAGSQVEAGQGVVVVEAMKMQNEMKAPRAGIVVSIAATEGMTVNSGDLLAVIE